METTMAEGPRPNIILIVMDAVRAENCSLHGYDKQTMRSLERYRDHLAVYDQCVSAATWTLPSSTSLFTGTYASTHGLVHDGDMLDPKYRTLAEILVQQGYFTSKITGQVPYVSDFSGLDRGFAASFEPEPSAIKQWWRDRKRKAVQASGEQRHEGVDLGLDLKAEADMNARGGAKARLKFWLSGFADAGAGACFEHAKNQWQAHRDQPRFFYMHLQETHAEYRPPHQFRKRFLRPELKGENFAAINQRPNPHAVGLIDMSEQDYEILTGLYDGCIAYLDSQIGYLMHFLSKQPDWDNTMVIVTADHGDCIGRHGVLGHQFVCYDELVRIPWIVKWPKSIGVTGSQDQLIQNLDLLPTISRMLGLDVPEQCEGIDILNQSRDVAVSELIKPFGMSAVKQGLHERAPQYHRAVLSMRSATHKLMTYSNSQTDEFFDLKSDPREENNLLVGGVVRDAAHVDEATRLRAELEAWRPRWQAAADAVESRIFGDDEADIAPEVEERLRALGYID